MYFKYLIWDFFKLDSFTIYLQENIRETLYNAETKSVISQGSVPLNKVT